MRFAVVRTKYSSVKAPVVMGFLRELPWLFISMLFVIFGVGCLTLYSAAGGVMQPWAALQLMRFIVFMPIVVAIALIPHSVWLRLSPVIYVLGLLLLVAVLLVGVEGGLGAQRWLNIAGFQFQPSELIKVGLVLILAYYYHYLHLNQLKHWFFLFLPALMIGVPCLFVLLQPNLGTAAIIGFLGVIILFLAGVNWKVFVVGLVLLGAAVPVAWNFVLHDYQKQRVTTFINPESDPLGAGYNIIQSKIAIGSGGFFGKGFVKGTQSQLSFVPERHTDFIFSIFAEEFGFLGSMVLIGCYIGLLFAGFLIAFRAQETFSRIIAMGMSSILFLHVFINLGMVMGMMPVVGVPLPLLSYGGSSMLGTMIACGFIFNSHVYRNKQLPHSV